MTATETHTTEPGPAFRAVERVGNKVPRAFWIFWYLLIATGIVSAILAATHTTVTTPGTDKTVAVNNILSIAGLQHLLSTFVANFIGFPPLGVVLTVLLGVGVAERTGFLKAAVVAFLAHVPAKLVPFAVMFVAGQGHVMGDASVIVLPPLAALVSRAAGRHPLAGLLGSFGGTMTGYASGVLIGALDANLSTLTASAVPHGINANVRAHELLVPSRVRAGHPDRDHLRAGALARAELAEVRSGCCGGRRRIVGRTLAA